MLMFALAILVGALAGLLLGGRFANLTAVHMRMPALVWIALGVQLTLGLAPLRSLPDDARFAVVVASYAMIGAWLALNARFQRAVPMCAAFALLATGWLLNLMVMVPNGGMPVSPAALADSGAPPHLEVDEGHLWKHVELSPSTALPVLGDVIAVPGGAVSAGDFVMVVGLIVAVAAGMVGIRSAGRPDGGDRASAALGRLAVPRE